MVNSYVYWVTTFWGHVKVIFEPGLDHIWPNFKYTPARALKFSRLSNHGLWQMSMLWLSFRPMALPGSDHVGTMFGLALLLVYFLHYLLVCWFSHPLTQVLMWLNCRPLVLLQKGLNFYCSHVRPGEEYTDWEIIWK